jgi:hypothetical protein
MRAAEITQGFDRNGCRCQLMAAGWTGRPVEFIVHTFRFFHMGYATLEEITLVTLFSGFCLFRFDFFFLGFMSCSSLVV